MRCCRWLLLLAVAGGCSGPSETSVRVRISYDADWGLDGFRVQAQDREEPAPVATELTLLVPDEWAGQDVSIQLWGMRADEEAAYGGVEAVPRRGAEVSVDLVMTLVTCGTWCNAGETRCDGDGVVTCEEDQDGCLAWSEPVSCSAEAPFCSLGECRADCVDECGEGETRCDGPEDVLACGEADSDTCLDWLPAAPCPGGVACEGDTCSEDCTGEGSCNSPPDPFCYDDEILRTFDASGTCGDGTCEYGYTDMTCPNGCSGGACAEPQAAIAIEAGGEHTCAITEEGEVVCWGRGTSGETTPPAGTFRSVSAGLRHTCGIRRDGTVACWGWNELGQAGPPAGAFNSVSAGGYQTCGQATADGEAVCWGSPDYGAVDPGQVVSDISCGGEGHNCGLAANSTIYCWGDDSLEQVSGRPGAGETFTQVSAGIGHVCAVRTDKTLRCWGYGIFGQATPPSGEFLAVGAGGFHTCGIRTDGAIACWGRPDYDQTTPPAGSFTALSAGDYHNCAIRTDGAVLCWGRDDFGQSTPPGFLAPPRP